VKGGLMLHLAYNQSNESADLQVRVFEWRQNAGQDQLIPTDEIVISPPFCFTTINWFW
jgi:P pilus assembly chaperone PapD